jgi:hypothetical protein
VLRAWVRFRANRLARALGSALAASDRARVFAGLSDVLEAATHSEWIALVSWQEDGLGGEIELSRGDLSAGDGPHERALMSWLVREAESRDELLTTSGHELGGEGAYVALPLRRENSALTGFVVLRTPRTLQRHVGAALSGSLDAIGLALAPGPDTAPEQPASAA